MTRSGRPPAADPPSRTDLESTASLLEQVRGGDGTARERLMQRFLPALRQWARGRLPSQARDLADTDDLVQVTLLRALNKLEEFEPRREGSFLAYLRRILQNEIRDQIRRARVRPSRGGSADHLPAMDPSPLEEAIGKEFLEKYESALERLSADQQEAVMMRIELGFTHQQVAEALGSPSADAARMLVTRALVRLAEVMHEG